MALTHIFMGIVVLLNELNSTVGQIDINLYDRKDFEGKVKPIWVGSSTHCVSTFGRSLQFAKPGGCVVVYKDKECKSEGYTIWSEERDLFTLRSRYENIVGKFYANSIRACTDMELRGTVDVDFIEGKTADPRKVEIRNLLNCTELSLADFSDSVHVARTYGKCLKLYKTKYCGGSKPQYLYSVSSYFSKITNWQSVEPCHKATLEFFNGKEFNGLTYVVGSSPKCNKDVPRSKYFRNQDVIPFSLKTTGCVILYDNTYCDPRKPYAFVVMTENDDLGNILNQYMTIKEGYKFIVKSFNDCGDMETSLQNYVEYNDGGGGDLETINNLCRCENLNINENRLLLYTYGKCVKIYLMKNCVDLYAISHAWGDTYVLPSAPIIGHLKAPFSIEPCDLASSEKCFKIKAMVLNMERISSTSDFPGNIKDFPMSLTQTFENDGFATIHKAIKVSKEISELASFEFSQGFRNLDNVQWTHTAEIGFEAEFELISSVTGKISSQYSNGWEREKSSSNTSKTETTTKETFITEETIVIQPCMEYDVYSTVRMTQNAVTNFEFEFEVTGTTGFNRRLTFYELKKHLEKNSPDITLLLGHKRENMYTIVGKSTTKFTFDYGAKTKLHATGRPILDCIERHKELKNSLQWFSK